MYNKGIMRYDKPFNVAVMGNYVKAPHIHTMYINIYACMYISM